MSGSISASTKRRGRPVTTGTGKTIGVRLHADMINALDAFIEKEAAGLKRPKASRPNAIRYALADWLEGNGYLRHDDDPKEAK